MVAIKVNIDFRQLFTNYSKTVAFLGIPLTSWGKALEFGLKSSERCVEISIFVQEKCDFR